jgi:hypothetical protein
MKIYRTVFQRPDTSVAFPPMNDGALSAHIQTAYSLTSPVKLLSVATEISQDLLTLIVTRTFATSADALEFSQDPQFVAWQAAQEQTLTESGVLRANTFAD